MGSSIPNIKNLARKLLHDAGDIATAHEFSDQELEIHMNRANTEVSEASPYERKLTIATVSGSKEIDLSAYTDDIIEVLRVEYPVDQSTPKLHNVTMFGNTARMVIDTIPSGTNAYLYVLAIHSLTETTSTMNKLEEEALVLGTAAYTAEAWLHVIRTELKSAFDLIATAEGKITDMNARLTQALADIASARAKVNTITIANAVRDFADLASREASVGNGYLNQSIGYLREMSSQLSEARAVTAYHSKVNQQLAEYRDRLMRITKPRNWQEYPK